MCKQNKLPDNADGAATKKLGKLLLLLIDYFVQTKFMASHYLSLCYCFLTRVLSCNCFLTKVFFNAVNSPLFHQLSPLRKIWDWWVVVCWLQHCGSTAYDSTASLWSCRDVDCAQKLQYILPSISLGSIPPQHQILAVPTNLSAVL